MDCQGNDITLDAMNNSLIPPGNGKGGKVLDFWEAWYFPHKSESVESFKLGSPDDNFGDVGFDSCTIGQISTRGQYTEVKGRIPSPPMFQGAIIQAGKAWASIGKPPHTPMGPYRQHNLVVKWDCCTQ